MTIYRAITKKQFAMDAGISMRTLLSWLYQFRDQLIKAEQNPRDKILNPAAVKLLSEHFCVEPKTAIHIKYKPIKTKGK